MTGIPPLLLDDQLLVLAVLMGCCTCALYSVPPDGYCAHVPVVALATEAKMRLARSAPSASKTARLKMWSFRLR